MFTINDISGLSTNIPLHIDVNRKFEDVLKSLEIGNFKTTTSYKANFDHVMDAAISKITFTGNGFQFGLLKTKFSSQFLIPYEFVDTNPNTRMKREKPAKLFAKENLLELSSDFNYILGLILGKLDLDKKYELTFKIRLSKEISSISNLNYMLTEPNALFGDITTFQLTGIHTTVVEKLFDTNVQSIYHLLWNKDEESGKNFCTLDAVFEFNHSGPIDFFKLVTESISRLNSLVMNVRGSNESTE